MPIYANPPGGSQELHPEGLFAAVCIDVIDRGLLQSSQYPAREKVDLRWLTTVENEDTGKRLWINKRYTNSLHEKSTLRKDLETWRGKRFSKEELQRFDLETLLGKPCQVQIVHNPREDGAVWANVTAVLPAAKREPKVVLNPGEYNRVVTTPTSPPPPNGPRPVNGPTKPERADYDDADLEDDSIPF